MVADKNYKYTAKTFTIENNIIKGIEVDVDLKNESIGHSLIKKYDEVPNQVAQIETETGKRTTFAEIKDSTIRCALWMQKQGIRSGDVVSICTHNQLDDHIPFIATFLVGAIYNPWHHEVSLVTARHLMSLTRPKVMFSCESAVNTLMEAAKLEKVDTKIIVFGKYPGKTSLRDIMKLQTNEEVRTFQVPTIEDMDSIAMILFSSGTTGLPKGVAHSYKTISKKLSFIPTGEECIYLWYSSLYWISGTLSILQTFISGATRIIHPNFDPEETCKVIEKYQVTQFFISPSSLTHWSKSNVLKNYKLESLKRMFTGGAKLSREILEDVNRKIPHVKLIQGYAMTETGGITTIRTDECQKIESVGFVAANNQIKIIDLTTGEALGPNQAGEICIKSPTLMVGYYKNLAATKATIDNEGWLHSGDKAYYAENGEFFIIDRIKEVMKFRGHHVSPFEIEEILLSHPAVMEVGVVPIPHELDLERPMAFVKKVPGIDVTEEELIALSSELGDCKKLWGGVKFLNELPYTASGKLSRKELRDVAKSLVKC